MFLMQLTTKEKFSFLHVAHYVSIVDGVFTKEEQSILDEYCTEMGIDDMIFDIESFNLDEKLSEFKTINSQRILILELMILIHVDDKYNKMEEDLMHIMQNKFNMTDRAIKYASTWGKAISALREQALEMIEFKSEK